MIGNSLILRLFLTLFLVLEAQAHFPVFLKKDPSLSIPYILNRPYEKSIAIYTHFESIGDIDVYQFSIDENDLKKGDIRILIGTLVPACEPLKELLISWALVGPKQKMLGDLDDVSILEKIEYTKEKGIFVIHNRVQGKVWHEPYTSHYYFYQKRQVLDLNKVGDYKIFVWSSSGQKGDYVFEFGEKEMWSLGDIFYTLWVYPKLLFEAEIETENCKTSDMN